MNVQTKFIDVHNFMPSKVPPTRQFNYFYPISFFYAAFIVYARSSSLTKTAKCIILPNKW